LEVEGDDVGNIVGVAEGLEVDGEMLGTRLGLTVGTADGLLVGELLDAHPKPISIPSPLPSMMHKIPVLLNEKVLLFP